MLGTSRKCCKMMIKGKRLQDSMQSTSLQQTHMPSFESIGKEMRKLCSRQGTGCHPPVHPVACTPWVIP